MMNSSSLSFVDWLIDDGNHQDESHTHPYVEIHMLRTDLARLTAELNRCKKNQVQVPPSPDVETLQAELTESRAALHRSDLEIRRLEKLLREHASAPAPKPVHNADISADQIIKSKDMLIRELRKQNAALRRDLSNWPGVITPDRPDTFAPTA